MIKEKTGSIREFIKGLINSDMSKEQIDNHERFVKMLDEIDQEDESKDKEIRDCKDKIVSLIKAEGSSNPPEDGDKKPRTLEEIAQATLGGK